MSRTNFAGLGIGITLKNFRQLILSFPKKAGSVAVISPYRIGSQIQTWKKLLPNVKPYYAVKCNPERAILQAMYNNGAGFDCASLKEVYEVNTLRVNNESNAKKADIIYAHPMKSERDICLVDSMHIQTTVVDSVEECEKLYKYGWRGSAFVRVAVEDSGSKMPFSSKFGASKEEVEEIARISKIPLTGVSFHVGSGCEEPEQYKDAIQYAAGEVSDILRKFKHIPQTIDIGGGFSSDATFKETARVISDSISAFVPKGRRVIAEPGRYMAQPSQDLFVKIIAKKPLKDGGWRYVIDESLYGHFSCIPFDGQRPAWIHIPSEERVAILNKKQESILFGRTCDSLDVIARGPMEEMEVGDWLYFPLMGAYTSATASEFNGFPKPETMIDLEDQLPSTEVAWAMMNYIHDARPLTYSNSLPPIT